jgi:hypothetical protein
MQDDTNDYAELVRVGGRKRGRPAKSPAKGASAADAMDEDDDDDDEDYDGRVFVTPGCQIGYIDHTDCHQLVF